MSSFTSYQLFALLSNVAIVIILVIVFGVTSELVDPFQRGFFCDDESIKKPYVHPETVSTSWAVVMDILLIVVVVVVCDCINRRRTPCSDEKCITAKKLRMNQWMYIMLVRLFTGFLGLGFTMILVNIGKLMVGRLRPHFLAVCNPPTGACTGFVTIDVCNTTNTKALREARLSFPSGHAGGVAFVSVFFALYVEYAMQPVYFLLLKPLVQFMILFGGFAVCFTRISDYYHHWSDVLTGILIGTLFAFYTIYKLMHLPSALKYLRSVDETPEYAMSIGKLDRDNDGKICRTSTTADNAVVNS